MNIFSPLYCLVLSTILMYSCGNNPQELQPGKSNPAPESPSQAPKVSQLNIPLPNPDSLYYFVEKQVLFGPRVPGSIAHKKCGDFIVQTLKSLGEGAPDVIEQHSTAWTFDNKNIPVRNIIASFNPNHSRRVLLAAHWDTRPFAEMDPKHKHKPIEGANDGGSGVAVLLEIARLIALQTPNLGIDLIFFDAEDWGDTTGLMEDTYCLGSQYWAQNPHTPYYYAEYGILLDMVGAKNSLFAVEEYSRSMAGKIVEKVWTTAEKLGYGDLFIRKRRGAVIDDHYYVMKYRQFPMVDIINYDPNSYSRFGDTWHTHNDNLENIDPEVMQKVAHTVLTVLYKESEGLL